MSSLAISTSGLTRRFGSTLAVDGLDLRVPSGRVTGFLGPNGAGKSTTIKMLLGLLRPDEGTVRLFGEPLSDHGRKRLSRLGALVETPSLHGHLSGRENLELTRRMLALPRGRIDRVLAVVDMVDAAGRLTREYSLGMRQRLGLAQAMLPDPDLLILDEPANGLDPAGIREMRALIRRLPEEHGTTVFLSSHLLGEVEQVASRVAIIGRGRLVFQGSLEELRVESRGHLVVGVDRPKKAAAWLESEGFVVDSRDGARLKVRGSGQEDAARLCQKLVGAGYAVHYLTSEQATLESAFLDLTESEPEEDGA